MQVPGALRALALAATGADDEKEDSQAAGDDATMRKVAPTLRYEGLLLAEAAGTISRFDTANCASNTRRPTCVHRTPA